MEKTAIFTISKGSKGYNIKSVAFSAYDVIEIPGIKIFQAMTDLTDYFNNTLKIAILFEVA
ncbi:MAG: hypothetical protein IJX39_06095 [Clostridia bacterium]|nr:hypothetical protein [Clostridia bacterium]